MISSWFVKIGKRINGCDALPPIAISWLFLGHKSESKSEFNLYLIESLHDFIITV